MANKKQKTKQPQYYTSRINTRVLNYDVYKMSASEKLLYSIGLLVVGGLIGLVFYGGLFKSAEGADTLLTYISNVVVFVVFGCLGIKYFMPSIVESLKKKRIDRLKKQFCDFAAALANSLSSGMNMNDALNAVYDDLVSQFSEDAFIVKEVREVIDGMNNNIPIETMLGDFGKRSGVDDILNFAEVFATCYRSGGDIKSVVRRTTDIISDKIMITAEIETTLTSNKMQMNIMTILPIVIVFMMRMMSQEFAQSFGSLVGVIGITVTVVLTIAAYKLGNKIMDIKG